jgi:hypothetical protein
MKHAANKLLVLCLVALTSGTLGADDRYGRRGDSGGWGNDGARYGHELERGFADIGAYDWRLGDSRRGGREILYRVPGSKRWLVAPGEATSISNGWVLGTDRHRGGFGIYRWNGRGWSRMPGEALEIGGSHDRPWVVNATGTRFTWNGYEWRENIREDHRSRGRDRDRDFRRDSFRR